MAGDGTTRLRVGRLTKAHGLKGGLKVELYTDEPDRRFVPGAVFDLQVPEASPWHGKTIELAELRWYNTNAVGFFKDVPDRTVAETLVKAIMWVDQDDAELPVEDDAWYDHQLVGLAVERDGRRVGTVARVDHLPAQDLLAVQTDDAEVLVPFVKAIVPTVDIDAGVVTVTPPAGLFEELPDDESDPPSATPARSARPAAEPAAGSDAPSADVSGAEVPGPEVPGADGPGADVPGADVPGADGPDADVPGADVPGADVPGADVPGAAASDSPEQTA